VFQKEVDRRRREKRGNEVFQESMEERKVTMFKVAELRRYLEGLKDDLEVIVAVPAEGYEDHTNFYYRLDSIGFKEATIEGDTLYVSEDVITNKPNTLCLFSEGTL
jgi:predicted Zn-dependent protease